MTPCGIQAAVHDDCDYGPEKRVFFCVSIGLAFIVVPAKGCMDILAGK